MNIKFNQDDYDKSEFNKIFFKNSKLFDKIYVSTPTPLKINEYSYSKYFGSEPTYKPVTYTNKSIGSNNISMSRAAPRVDCVDYSFDSNNIIRITFYKDYDYNYDSYNGTEYKIKLKSYYMNDYTPQENNIFYSRMITAILYHVYESDYRCRFKNKKDVNIELAFDISSNKSDRNHMYMYLYEVINGVILKLYDEVISLSDYDINDIINIMNYIISMIQNEKVEINKVTYYKGDV